MDFGYNVVATNEHLRAHSKGKLQSKTYSFQVKSWHIQKNVIDERSSKAGIRKTASVTFKIKKDCYNQLLKNPDAYLLCYLVESIPNNEDNIWGEFWLNSLQLKFLDKHGFIAKPDDKCDLIYIYTLITTQAHLQNQIQSDFDNIEKSLKAFNSVDTEQENLLTKLSIEIEQLKRHIQKTPLLNLNSNTNIYLQKGPHEKDQHLLSPEQHDLNRFDEKEKIDECPFLPA